MPFRVRLPLATTMSGLVLATVTAAGAAGIHRMTTMTAVGSGSSSAVVQSDASLSAFQGEVASSPNANIKIPFGVMGEYDPAGSSRFGIGVIGISTTGYGVGAEALGTNPAMIAINASDGDGFDAIADGDGIGVNASALYNQAVRGYSKYDSGLEGDSDAENASAVAGYSTAGDGGYFLSQSSAAGTFSVFAESQNAAAGIGVYNYAATPGETITSNGAGLISSVDSNSVTNAAIIADVGALNPDEIEGQFQGNTTMRLTGKSGDYSGTVDTSNYSSSDLILNGDIFVTGAIYTQCGSNLMQTTPCAGSSLSGAVRTGGGEMRQTYPARQTSATIEDAGEAQLINGFAHVVIDAAFASTISRTDPYLVFMTPNGASRGLYVSHKDHSGFDVRENPGGSFATIAFDYRILAKPFGDQSMRLAVVHASTGQVRSGPGNLVMRAIALNRKHAQALAEHSKLRVYEHHAIDVDFANFRKK